MKREFGTPKNRLNVKNDPWKYDTASKILFRNYNLQSPIRKNIKIIIYIPISLGT